MSQAVHLRANLRLPAKLLERREVPRRVFQVNVPATLSYQGQTRRIVFLADISQKGIGFLSAELVPAGTVVSLELSGGKIGNVNLGARVVHATAGEQWNWRIG